MKGLSKLYIRVISVMLIFAYSTVSVGHAACRFIQNEEAPTEFSCSESQNAHRRSMLTAKQSVVSLRGHVKDAVELSSRMRAWMPSQTFSAAVTETPGPVMRAEAADKKESAEAMISSGQDRTKHSSPLRLKRAIFVSVLLLFSLSLFAAGMVPMDGAHSLFYWLWKHHLLVVGSFFGIITLWSHVKHKTLFSAESAIDQEGVDIEEKLGIFGKISRSLDGVDQYLGWIGLLAGLIYVSYLFTPLATFLNLSGAHTIFVVMGYTIGLRYVLLGFYQLWGFLAVSLKAIVVPLYERFFYAGSPKKRSSINPMEKLGEFLSIGVALLFFIGQGGFKTVAFLLGLLVVGETIAGKMNSLFDQEGDDAANEKVKAPYSRAFRVANVLRSVLTFSPFVIAGIVHLGGNSPLAMGVLVMVCAADIILGYKTIMAAGHYGVKKMGTRNTITDSVLVSPVENVYVDARKNIRIADQGTIYEEIDESRTKTVRRVVAATRGFVWGQLVFLIAGVCGGVWYLSGFSGDMIFSNAVMVHFWFDIIAPLFGVVLVVLLFPNVLKEKWNAWRKTQATKKERVRMTPLVAPEEMQRQLKKKYGVTVTIPDDQLWRTWKTLEAENYKECTKPHPKNSWKERIRLKNIIGWHLRLIGTLTGISIFTNAWRYHMVKYGKTFLTPDKVQAIVENMRNGAIEKENWLDAYVVRWKDSPQEKILSFLYSYVGAFFLRPLGAFVMQRGTVILLGGVAMGFLAGAMPFTMLGSSLISASVVEWLAISISNTFLSSIITGCLSSLTVGNLLMKGVMAAGLAAVNTVKRWRVLGQTDNHQSYVGFFLQSWLKTWGSLIVFQFSMVWLGSIAQFFNVTSVFHASLSGICTPVGFVVTVFDWAEALFVKPILGDSIANSVFQAVNKNPEHASHDAYDVFSKAHCGDEQKSFSENRTSEELSDMMKDTPNTREAEMSGADAEDVLREGLVSEEVKYVESVQYKTIQPVTVLAIGDPHEKAYYVSFEHYDGGTMLGETMPSASELNVVVRLGEGDDFRPTSFRELVDNDPVASGTREYWMVCKDPETHALLGYPLTNGFFLEQLQIMGVDGSHYHLAGENAGGVGVKPPDVTDPEQGFYRAKVPLDMIVEKEVNSVIQEGLQDQTVQRTQTGGGSKISVVRVDADMPVSSGNSNTVVFENRSMNADEEVIVIPENSSVSKALIRNLNEVTPHDFITEIYDADTKTFRDGHGITLNDGSRGRIMQVLDPDGNSVENLDEVFPGSSIVIERLSSNQNIIEQENQDLSIKKEGVQSSVEINFVETIEEETETVDLGAIQKEIKAGGDPQYLFSKAGFESVPSPEQETSDPSMMFQRDVMVLCTHDNNVIRMPQGTAEVMARDPQHPSHFHMGIKEESTGEVQIFTIHDGAQFYRYIRSSENAEDVVVFTETNVFDPSGKEVSVLKQQGSAFHVHGKRGGHLEFGIDTDGQIGFATETRLGEDRKWVGEAGFAAAPEFFQKGLGSFEADLGVKGMPWDYPVAIGGIAGFTAEEAVKNIHTSAGAYTSIFHADITEKTTLGVTGGLYGGGTQHFSSEDNADYLTGRLAPFSEASFSFPSSNVKIFGMTNFVAGSNQAFSLEDNTFLGVTWEQDLSFIRSGAMGRMTYGVGNDGLMRYMPLEVAGHKGLGVELGFQGKNHALWGGYNMHENSAAVNLMIGFIGEDPLKKGNALHAFSRQEPTEIPQAHRKTIDRARTVLLRSITNNMEKKQEEPWKAKLQAEEKKILLETYNFMKESLESNRVLYFMKDAEYRGEYTTTEGMTKHRFAFAESQMDNSLYSHISIAREMLEETHSLRQMAELIGHELAEPFVRMQLEKIKDVFWTREEVQKRAHTLARILLEEIFEYDRRRDNPLKGWIQVTLMSVSKKHTLSQLVRTLVDIDGIDFETLAQFQELPLYSESDFYHVYHGNYEMYELTSERIRIMSAYLRLLEQNRAAVQKRVHAKQKHRHMLKGHLERIRREYMHSMSGVLAKEKREPYSIERLSPKTNSEEEERLMRITARNVVALFDQYGESDTLLRLALYHGPETYKIVRSAQEAPHKAYKKTTLRYVMHLIAHIHIDEDNGGIGLQVESPRDDYQGSLRENLTEMINRGPFSLERIAQEAAFVDREHLFFDFYDTFQGVVLLSDFLAGKSVDDIVKGYIEEALFRLEDSRRRVAVNSMEKLRKKTEYYIAMCGYAQFREEIMKRGVRDVSMLLNGLTVKSIARLDEKSRRILESIVSYTNVFVNNQNSFEYPELKLVEERKTSEQCIQDDWEFLVAA